MFRFLLSSVVGAALAAPHAVLQAQTAEDALAIRAVRYYRPDAGRTLVKAFVEVPYTLLHAGSAGPDAMMTYAVSARVLDSSGLSLEALRWSQRVPAQFKMPRAVGLEQMQFAVPAGTYRLEVSVEDSVTGRKSQVEARIEGYAAAPPASDLLLSPAMRVADTNDSVPQPGEMRVGSTMIVPAALLRLSPLRAKAYYFLEAYTGSEQEQSGTMHVAVIGADGASVFKTAPVPIRLAAGGGILKGQVDLDGLPEGRYTLQVVVSLNGRTTERSAELVMAPLDETLAADTAAAVRNLVGDAGYFAAMNEAELDTAAAPLALVAKSREMRPYQGLSVAAKRRFLTDFWTQRDPTPGTERNEAREQFYGAIAYANETYRVGRGKQEMGWQTDRGRIYTKHGAPDDVLRRVPTGEAPPYEIWRYTRGRPKYYIFADRTGIGAFRLIHTNDLQETGIPTWRDIIKEDAVRDAGQFLGIDFYSGSSGSNL